MDKEVLNTKEVCEYLGITRTSLWRLCKEDMLFPKPILLLSQKKWRKSDLEQYLKDKQQER